MEQVGGGFSPFIAIDREAPKPLHRQIYERYRTAILQGVMKAGQQVPSTRSLSLELRISRIPIFNAYAQLLAEGYFEIRAGAGTFVSQSLPEQSMPDAPRASGSPSVHTGSRTVSRYSLLLPDRGHSPWTYGSGAFSVGQLAFDHFPMRVWSNLLSRHSRRVRANSLNYGDAMGSKEFRETIATYLRSVRAVHCEPNQILVVSGSQQALDLSARVLLDPGSRVWRSL